MMYISLKSDCYFRKYGSIGYITRPVISKEEVVDENGILFLERINYEPKKLVDVVEELAECYEEVDRKELECDAIDFFTNLANDGFLNIQESNCDETKDFTYQELEGKVGYSEIKTQLEESSSQFLVDYFKNNPYLVSFHIELTSRCNERCIHCYIPHANKTKDITKELMFDVLSQCHDLGVLTVVFSGGEPMLHPEFCDFLKKAKEYDLNVTVLSNAMCIDDEIIKALKYRHATCVNVSLYSMVPSIHDSITTVKGSFEVTKKNIERLIKNNIPVQINCPVMKQNMGSFGDVIRWGQDHKCSVVTDYLIMARYDHTTDNLQNRISVNDLESVIKQYIKSDVVLQDKLSQLSFDDRNRIIESSDDRVCGVGMTTMCMVSSGEVYPCAGWQKYVCGNVNETSLRRIWEESPQIQYLRGLRQRDFTECSGCKNKEYCLLCISRNSNEASDGDIFKISPITCQAAEVYHRVIDGFRSKKERK